MTSNAREPSKNVPTNTEMKKRIKTVKHELSHVWVCWRYTTEAFGTYGFFQKHRGSPWPPVVVKVPWENAAPYYKTPWPRPYQCVLANATVHNSKPVQCGNEQQQRLTIFWAYPILMMYHYTTTWTHKTTNGRDRDETNLKHMFSLGDVFIDVGTLRDDTNHALWQITCVNWSTHGILLKWCACTNKSSINVAVLGMYPNWEIRFAVSVLRSANSFKTESITHSIVQWFFPLPPSVRQTPGLGTWARVAGVLLIHICILRYIQYIHTYIHAYIHTDKQTDRQTDRQKDIQTYKHTGIQTHKQTNIRACMHTHIHTQTYIYIYIDR